MLPINLVSDLEIAIATGSHKTGAMLHRITDLFLIHAGHYSVDQLSVYDDVLRTLVDKVEIAARAVLQNDLRRLTARPPKQSVR